MFNQIYTKTPFFHGRMQSLVFAYMESIKWNTACGNYVPEGWDGEMFWKCVVNMSGLH